MASTTNLITTVSPPALPASGHPIAADFTDKKLEKIEKVARAYIFIGGSIEEMGKRFANMLKDLAERLKTAPKEENSTKLFEHASNLRIRLKRVLNVLAKAKADYYQNTFWGRLTKFFGFANAIHNAHVIYKNADEAFINEYNQYARELRVHLESQEANSECTNSPDNEIDDLDENDQNIVNDDKANDPCDNEGYLPIVPIMSDARRGTKKLSRKRTIRPQNRRRQRFDDVVRRKILPLERNKLLPKKHSASKHTQKLANKLSPKEDRPNRVGRIIRADQEFNENYGQAAPKEWFDNSSVQVLDFL